MPPEAQEGGAARTGGGCPTHSEDGERLIGSVCRQDKDSSRAGAGSLECLPDNAQNLAEDEQLPGRIAWKSEEPGLLILPPSLPAPPITEGVAAGRQQEECVPMRV